MHFSRAIPQIRNTEAADYVQRRLPFNGNNMKGRIEFGPYGTVVYMVYSYDRPVIVNAGDKWFVNASRTYLYNTAPAPHPTEARIALIAEVKVGRTTFKHITQAGGKDFLAGAERFDSDESFQAAWEAENEDWIRSYEIRSCGEEDMEELLTAGREEELLGVRLAS